jgi:hypothetical protein
MKLSILDLLSFSLHFTMAQTTLTAGPIGLDNSMQVDAAEGNLSLVLEAVKNVSFAQKPVIPPGPGQVQVNIRQTGICGR